MTLKEAKKILEKEFIEIGFHKSTEPFEFDESRWFVGEKPEVLDAFRVLSKEGYYIAISGHDYDMRKARLGRPTDKPSSDTPSTLNPALKEAASQFNDALLDEQGKKIAELTKENERLKDQIAILDACKKHNDKIDRKQIKSLGKEIAKLNGIIHDKNAVLSDVAEELRLTKIREKNLTEVGQKYMKENEELREKLADKVVDKIDAQALKSAESALAWKEKVVAAKDMALAYYEKKIAEKGEVIADLGKELAETKKEMGVFKESYKRRIKEDSECFEHIQKICNAGLQKWLLESEYLEKDKPFRFRNFDIASGNENKKPRIPTPEISDEELMNIQEKVVASCDIAEEGGDHSGVIVLCGKDVFKKFKENEESVFDFFKRHKETAEELHEVADEALEQLLLFGEIIIKTEK